MHVRPAAKLVHLANSHKSSIRLKVNGKIADARSIISIMLLCATFGALLEVEVNGEDEFLAASAIEQFFEADDAPADTLTTNGSSEENRIEE